MTAGWQTSANDAEFPDREAASAAAFASSSARSPAVPVTATAPAARNAPASASSAQARIDGRTFRLVQGDDLVKAWRHPEGGFEKCFCGECGAQLFSRNPDDPTQMSVRMSAFDGDPGVRPSWRAYVAYAMDREPIPDDGLERFEEGRLGAARR